MTTPAKLLDLRTAPNEDGKCHTNRRSLVVLLHVPWGRYRANQVFENGQSVADVAAGLREFADRLEAVGAPE